MGANFSRLKNWSAGEKLTASQLNAEFNQILNNLDPTGIDDESANDAAAQATSDPYPGSSLSKAVSLEKEIQQLRYLITQITGETYWYIDPDIALDTIYTALNGGLDPADIDDESANDAAAQATKDPYASSSLVKATSLQEEIQELRYLIAQITGETYWYIDPDNNIATIHAALIEAGTIMLFGQNSAPTGWTKKTDWQDNAMLCYATGNVGSGGSVNPQSTHVHAGGSHALTITEMPAHTHTDTAHDAGTTTVPGSGNSAGGSRGITSDSTGGGNAHSHGNTDANTAPHYQEVIAATKD